MLFITQPFRIIVLYEEIFTWRLARDKVIDELEIEKESERHGLQIILHLAFKFGNCIAKFHWTRLSNICTSDKPYYSAFNAKERNWIILFVLHLKIHLNGFQHKLNDIYDYERNPKVFTKSILNYRLHTKYKLTFFCE